jgi:NitT/TauT family transport system substrate-binding protein
MLQATLSHLRSAIAPAVLALLAGSGAVLAQDFPELVVTLASDDDVFNPTTSSVFQLAQDFGYFDRHEVKVTYVGLDGSPAAAAALQSGAVDVAHLTIDSAIRLDAANDLQVRGFLSVGTGIPFLIAAREDIATLEDLAGRSFAISDIGGLDHLLTQDVMRSFGLDADSPSFVAIGAPSIRVQALAAGQVDATTVSFGTFAAIEDTPGLHVLIAPDVFANRAPAQPKFLVAREDVIAEKREAIQRFTDAILEASRDFAAEPALWIEAAAAARPDLSAANIERIAAFNATLWCVNGCMKPEALQTSMDFIYATPDFADVPVIGLDDIVDYSFTETALAEMGVVETTGLDSRN